jgi:hypothetical protein
MLTTVKITITNPYIKIAEEFLTRVNLSDLTEVDMATDECCGQYLDMYADKAPGVDFAQLADACEYILEEVLNVN